MITYQHINAAKPKIPIRRTTQWIRNVAAGYGKKVGEVAYIFCNDAKILEINRQYLRHDYCTDIITFDYCENNVLSGDIFISIDTVCSNAQRFGTTPDNELRRVMIHGILHLCGQDDQQPSDQVEMTRKENAALTLWKQMEQP